MSNQIYSTFEPKTTIYTPPEVASYGDQHIEYIKNNLHRSLAFPVASIDKYFANMLPGDICCLIAQTSNYKTGFMQLWEYHAAKQLEVQGRHDEIIVNINLEDSIETQALLLISMESGQDATSLYQGAVLDEHKLKMATISIGAIPIYRIGFSLGRDDDSNLYLTNIIRSLKFMLETMLEGKKKIGAMFVNYLQILPIDPEIKTSSVDKQRRLQVMSDMRRLRRAASYFRCPVIVGVQAKQTLKGVIGEMMIPGIYDGEESSSIAQYASRVVTLWLPKTTHSVGAIIHHNDLSFEVEENDIFIKIAKQQGRLPAGKSFSCKVNYESNQIKYIIDRMGF